MMNLMPQQKPNHKPLLLLLFSVLIFSACDNQPRYPSPARSGSYFVVEIASLQPETPKFFTYQYNGKNISFFVMRMKNGVQSYLDACASCYPHKLGYHYESGAVTCRYCSQKFSVNQLDKGLGGCYPIKIVGRVEKGQYLIPVAILEKESDKF